MDIQVRRAVWDRAGGMCEITGTPLGERDSHDWECHHRRNKGMGGTSRDNVDALSNLLALTPRIHNGGPGSVHADRPWAEQCGYLLPKRVEFPSQWPVLLLGRRWVLLGDDGQYYQPRAAIIRPGQV